MGLSDFIMLVDRLGILGVVLTGLFLAIMFMGSVVDVFQFWHRVRRHRKRREKAFYNRVKAQVLMDLHESKSKDPTPR